MANQFIVVFKDNAGNLQLFPQSVSVNQFDTITWVSNVNESYVVGTFSPNSPLSANSFPMPPQGQTSPATVMFDPTQSTPFLYTCADSSELGVTTGDSATGIIIVDPPGGGPDDGKGEKERHRETSKAQAEEESLALQLNGSRR